MQEFLKHIDAKTITAAGGVLLAGFLGWGLIKLSTNDVSHLEGAVREHNAGDIELKKEELAEKKELNALLRDNVRVLERIEIKIK